MTHSRRRGGHANFAALDKDALRALAAAGGRASHRQGVAHQWTSEQARAARRSALPPDHHLLPSRKVDGRYEYLITDADGAEKWVSRQRIHQLRKLGRLR